MDAKLVVIGGAKEKEISLQLPTVIGRGREASLTLPHPLISRQHCELFELNGRLMVRDLGSLNGTYVANEQISEAELPPGELLTIGSVTFRAVYAAQAAASPNDSSIGPRVGKETVADVRLTVDDVPPDAFDLVENPDDDNLSPAEEPAMEPPVEEQVAPVGQADRVDDPDVSLDDPPSFRGAEQAPVGQTVLPQDVDDDAAATDLPAADESPLAGTPESAPGPVTEEPTLEEPAMPVASPVNSGPPMAIPVEPPQASSPSGEPDPPAAENEDDDLSDFLKRLS